MKINYAFNEILTIYQTTAVRINQKYTQEALTLNDEERCKLIEQGRFIVKRGLTEIKFTDKIYQVFDFFPYEKARIKDQVKVDAELEKLMNVYTAIKDTVALGDADTALSLLKEFREFTNGLLKDGGENGGSKNI